MPLTVKWLKMQKRNMSTITEFEFYKKLLEVGQINAASASKSILASDRFKSIYNESPTSIILREKVGRGSKYIINPKRVEEFERMFRSWFKESLKLDILNKVEAVERFNNSKAVSVKSKPIYFFRGINAKAKINDISIDVGKYTSKFNLFASETESVTCDVVCLVENKDVFLIAEKLFGEKVLFAHKYGRVGIDDGSLFSANKFIVFSDYDFVGLNDFLNIRTYQPLSIFYVPENIELLFSKYARPIKNQTASDKVKYAVDNQVKYIRSMIEKSGKFLEQQSLFIES